MSLPITLLASLLGLCLVFTVAATPANIYTGSADFVSPDDWYKTNVTSGRIFMDFSSPNATKTLWAGANGMNKISLCSLDGSTFGTFGRGQCPLGCVGGQCHKSGCWCQTPCLAYAMLCSLDRARYSGLCKVGGVAGELWNVVDAVSVCMSPDGTTPLGIIIYNTEVVVQFFNFKASVPETTWQLPPYCQSQCAV